MQCPICGSASSPALVKDGCEYRLCGDCDFLFYRPERDDSGAAILSFYDGHYWEMERSEALRREKEDCFNRAMELLYLSTIPVENMLDFGCGLGITVKLLREKLGLNAVGVDLSAEFEESSFLHRCELEVMLGKYEPHFFDAIYSIEVFEHLADPNRTLALLGKLLKPGGKILINTGTREYISKYDPGQTYVDPRRRGHISIYSLKSLARSAATIGYSAEFLGDRSYVVILSPAGCQALFPIRENLDRTVKLGDWHPAFLREYMRLLFVEKAFEEKCAWNALLLDEISRLKNGTGTEARSKPWKKIWKYITEG